MPRSLRDEAWKTCPVERDGTSTFYNTARVFEWARTSATLNVPVLNDEESKEDAKRLLKSKADAQQYDADRKLFLLAKLRRDMVPRDLIEDLVNGLLADLRQTILERTNRHAERLVGLNSTKEARERIEKMNAELLLVISRMPFSADALEQAMAETDNETEEEAEEPQEAEGAPDADE